MVARLTVELMRLLEVPVILLMVFIIKSVELIILDHLTRLMQPIKVIISVDIKLIITQTCIVCLGRKTLILIALKVTDLQIMDCLVLRTGTRHTMKGVLTWPLAGMMMKKEVHGIWKAMSTSAIIQFITEPKTKFAAHWGVCMIYRGITARPINIVAAQEMLHIAMLIDIWSKYHARNVRSLIMGAVTGATSMEVMVMATNIAEVH
jgi:hypothetical protein